MTFAVVPGNNALCYGRTAEMFRNETRCISTWGSANTRKLQEDLAAPDFFSNVAVFYWRVCESMRLARTVNINYAM
jgi:hypothetical protein